MTELRVDMGEQKQIKTIQMRTNGGDLFRVYCNKGDSHHHMHFRDLKGEEHDTCYSGKREGEKRCDLSGHC